MKKYKILMCTFMTTFISISLYIINNYTTEEKKVKNIVPYEYGKETTEVNKVQPLIYISESVKQPEKYIESNIPVDNFVEYIDMDVPNINSSMKTYMSYKSITDTTSKQWELQQFAITNDEGFRMYDGLYMIALGTYYSPYAGIKFEIEFDTGKVIQCITGDLKDNRHTDKTNRYIEHNGNIVEFIIDRDCISSLSNIMGDMSHSDMEGNVVRITRVERNIY